MQLRKLLPFQMPFEPLKYMKWSVLSLFMGDVNQAKSIQRHVRKAVRAAPAFHLHSVIGKSNKIMRKKCAEKKGLHCK